MSTSAVEYFSETPRRYNCAQSVAAGAERFDLVPGFAAMGGGRAPDGLCGALYALLELLPEQERDAAKRHFAAKAGAIRCREIKGGTGFPCVSCVALAEQLLKDQAGK